MGLPQQSRQESNPKSQIWSLAVAQLHETVKQKNPLKFAPERVSSCFQLYPTQVFLPESRSCMIILSESEVPLSSLGILITIASAKCNRMPFLALTITIRSLFLNQHDKNLSFCATTRRFNIIRHFWRL